jgi:hypothetical protein
MREYISGLALALACCSSYGVERQHLADGSWQLTCKLAMDECVQQADKLCMDQRYRIARGQSRHVVRGAGPSQVEYRISELTVVCGGSDDDSAPPGGALTPVLSRSADSTNPVKSVCTPGATQACVGPGGCAGGQACGGDGSAFGPCDCGALKGASLDAG